jgi:hypothetical protein
LAFFSSSTFFSASFLFASAASKSIDPEKSELDGFLEVSSAWFNLVIETPFLEGDVLTDPFLREIVFLEVFFLPI